MRILVVALLLHGLHGFRVSPKAHGGADCGAAGEACSQNTPDVFMVSGAGIDSINGLYRRADVYKGRFRWISSMGALLFWDDSSFTRSRGCPATLGCWGLAVSGHHRYLVRGNGGQSPPTTGWFERGQGRSRPPVPTIQAHTDEVDPDRAPPNQLTVSGAGYSQVNGLFERWGTHNGKIRWDNNRTNAEMHWYDTSFTRSQGCPAVAGCWGLGYGGHHRYLAHGQGRDGGQAPPTTGWFLRSGRRRLGGRLPIPFVEIFQEARGFWTQEVTVSSTSTYEVTEGWETMRTEEFTSVVQREMSTEFSTVTPKGMVKVTGSTSISITNKTSSSIRKYINEKRTEVKKIEDGRYVWTWMWLVIERSGRESSCMTEYKIQGDVKPRCFPGEQRDGKYMTCNPDMCIEHCSDGFQEGDWVTHVESRRVGQITEKEVTAVRPFWVEFQDGGFPPNGWYTEDELERIAREMDASETT